jgi:protease-4
MEPQGELKLVGLHSERYYLRGLLDKVGVEGDFLARGEYKSAPETFTRHEASAASREETLTDLREAQGHLEKLLSESGRLNAAKLAKAYETALYGADEAKQAGLVDSVDSYAANNDGERAESIVSTTEERSESLALPPRVAVIVAAGDIMENKVRALSLGGETQVTPAQVKAQLDAALADSRTAAIVLRVDSPGGEILPSHEISVMVEKARERKPVVISMGDVAASGGYYISAPADRIFADPLTFTGSIGVFPHAALFAEDRPWSAEDRAVFVRRLNGYYTGFVSYVARNRHLSQTDAEAAAKGRVWLGDHAQMLALVDQNGGYREAIAYAAKKAGLDDDYEVWPLRESVGIFDFFGDQGLMAAGAAAPGRVLTGLFSPEAIRSLRWLESLRSNPFLYLSQGTLSVD